MIQCILNKCIVSQKSGTVQVYFLYLFSKIGVIHMAEITTRNRNKGKFYKDGRAKPANWEWRFEMASVEGKRQQKTEGGFKTQK